MPVLSVQWFPGHMAKAKRMMAAELKLVDVVVEVLDARAPAASASPLLDELIAGKPRVIALNKSDLADNAVTKQWLEYYAGGGLPAIILNSAKGGGNKDLLALLKKTTLPVVEKWRTRGVNNKSVRVMVAGIPNVGKSSLINRLAGGAKTKTADKPGVTRGKQWITVGRDLELLDTPGLLYPHLDRSYTAFALAVTGAVKDEVFDWESAALLLLEFLQAEYPANLAAKYNLAVESDPSALLSVLAEKKGCLRAGGRPDLLTAAKLLLTDFRAGRLGGISLERPGKDGLP